jgi:hypothetical protein
VQHATNLPPQHGHQRQGSACVCSTPAAGWYAPVLTGAAGSASNRGASGQLRQHNSKHHKQPCQTHVKAPRQRLLYGSKQPRAAWLPHPVSFSQLHAASRMRVATQHERLLLMLTRTCSAPKHPVYLLRPHEAHAPQDDAQHRGGKRLQEERAAHVSMGSVSLRVLLGAAAAVLLQSFAACAAGELRWSVETEL